MKGPPLADGPIAPTCAQKQQSNIAMHDTSIGMEFFKDQMQNVLQFYP